MHSLAAAAAAAADDDDDDDDDLHCPMVQRRCSPSSPPLVDFAVGLRVLYKTTLAVL